MKLSIRLIRIQALRKRELIIME